MKRTLTTLILLTSAIGYTSLGINNTALNVFYVLISASIFAIAGVGGILINSQEAVRDIRDIYRERSKIQNEKIAALKEKIIEQQKQILKLRGQKECRILSIEKN